MFKPFKLASWYSAACPVALQHMCRLFFWRPAIAIAPGLLCAIVYVPLRPAASPAVLSVLVCVVTAAPPLAEQHTFFVAHGLASL
jgi:predicted membrane metal-binding protein